MPFATRTTVIAGALAAAAIAAPAASARLDLEPAPTGQSQQQQQQGLYVNPSTGFATPVAGVQAQTSGPRPEVHPNRRDQTTVTTAGVHGSGPTGGHPAAVRVIAHPSPFDWGDAAIGAGGGLAVSLLVVGGALLVVRRRQPEGSPQKALVG